MAMVLANKSSSFSSSSSTLPLRPQLGRLLTHRPRLHPMVCASSELVEPLTLSTNNPDLTWQITAGAIAGVAPFVIAGVEFSKRIIQQRRCQVCGGSGLVKRVGLLVRCNGCGGFLPWQSWSRFFSSGR